MRRRDEEAKLVILGRVGRLLPKPDKGFSFALFHAVFSVLGIVSRGWAAPTPLWPAYLRTWKSVRFASTPGAGARTST